MVNRINEQRVKRDVSVKRLSEITGIPENEIALIESAGYNIEEMSAVKAAHIAQALDCRIGDLIYPASDMRI